MTAATRISFDCSRCVKAVTLTYFLNATAHTIRTVLRSSIRRLGTSHS